MLSETVLIAAITALAGLGGAGIGAYASIRIARNQGRVALSRCVIEGTYNARRTAYQKVFNAETDFVGNRNEKTANALLYSVKEACVVASASASCWMMALIESSVSNSHADFDAIRAEMLTAMQRDLNTFTEPRIEKNNWSNPRPKADGKDKGEDERQPKQ